MKRLLLSYDYELFFGDKSGTIQKSIIEPTSLLLDCFKKTGVRANFFIDYLMLVQLRKVGDEVCMNDLISIEKQIERMVSEGNRVELHIHSHWIDAKYLGSGSWDISNFDHYSLNTFSELDIVSMFQEGCNIIESIARRVQPNYKVMVFRAGGWAIQPFSLFKKAFEKTSILMDSSSSRGVFSDNSYSFFDFRNAPDKCIYKFSKDICVEDSSGQFVEVPIASYRRNYIHKILDHGYGVFFSNSMCRVSDGTHVRKSDGNTGKSKACTKAMMTIAGRSWMTIMLNIIGCKHSVVTFIDHPKDFSYVAITNIKLLSKLYKTILYTDLIK